MAEIKNENPFLDSYEKNSNNPIKILLGLYKGNYSGISGTHCCFSEKNRKHQCTSFNNTGKNSTKGELDGYEI